MPRGDHVPGCCGKEGQACKRLGERRKRHSNGAPPQPAHPVLEARIKDWERIKNSVDSRNRHDGQGNVFRKPGSQRKGR